MGYTLTVDAIAQWVSHNIWDDPVGRDAPGEVALLLVELEYGTIDQERFDRRVLDALTDAQRQEIEDIVKAQHLVDCASRGHNFSWTGHGIHPMLPPIGDYSCEECGESVRVSKEHQRGFWHVH